MISTIPAIKRLKIRNLGLIRKADFKFTKGINIIYGPNASGKTTAVNAISHLLNGEKLLYEPSKGSNTATIEIDFFYKKSSKIIKKGAFEKALKMNKRIKSFMNVARTNRINVLSVLNILSCGEKVYAEFASVLANPSKGLAIVMDDAFARLDLEHRKQILELLRKSKAQVIITVCHESELVKGANIIRLNKK